MPGAQNAHFANCDCRDDVNFGMRISNCEFVQIGLKGSTNSQSEIRNPKFLNGRDDWIRTSDLTHPKRARYQAAPRPDGGIQVCLENLNCQLAKRIADCELRIYKRSFNVEVDEIRIPKFEIRNLLLLRRRGRLSFFIKHREELPQFGCEPSQRITIGSGCFSIVPRQFGTATFRDAVVIRRRR